MFLGSFDSMASVARQKCAVNMADPSISWTYYGKQIIALREYTHPVTTDKVGGIFYFGPTTTQIPSFVTVAHTELRILKFAIFVVSQSEKD